MLSGFADHPTVLPIYFEMQRRSPNRMKKCLIYGFLIVLFLYIDIAYFGYFTFPTHVDPNLLLSNYRHNPVMLAAGAILCLYVISVVPLFAHAFRKSLAEILIEIENKKKLELEQQGLLGKDDNNNNNNNKSTDGANNTTRGLIAPEARDILEHPEVGIAFVPPATPKTQKKLSFGKVLALENEHNKSVQQKGHLDINDDSDSSFDSADSFDLDRDNQQGNSNNTNTNNGTRKQSEVIHDPFQLPIKLHAIVTLTFIGSALLAATFAPNIGTVNAMIGSTSMPIC